MDKKNGANKRQKSAGNPKSLKIATILFTVFSVVMLIVTFALIATEKQTHIFDNADILLVVMLVLCLALPAVAVILFFKYRKAAMCAKYSAKEEAGRSEAKRYGEIYCSQSQAAQIGNIFHDRLDNCPVCGTKLEYGSHYVLHLRVQVRKKVEGVYVAHNYSADVEQAYEAVDEMRDFPGAERYHCPQCKWEAFNGRYETYGFDRYYCDNRNLIKYYEQFKRGKLYRGIDLPADKGNGTGTFTKN